jgi:hypothetical protein
LKDPVRNLSADSIEEKHEKQRSQRDRILALLRVSGLAGVTNRELNKVGYRYGARLWELKKEGYDIRTESLGDGLYKFTLLNGPFPPKPQPAGESSTGTQPTLPLFAKVRE